MDALQSRTIKRIKAAGRPPLPAYNKGTKAVFDYEVRLLPGDYFVDGFTLNTAYTDYLPSDTLVAVDDTRRTFPHGYGRPLELVIGKEFQLGVLEQCLKTMQIGEIATFDVHAVELLKVIQLI